MILKYHSEAFWGIGFFWRTWSQQQEQQAFQVFVNRFSLTEIGKNIMKRTPDAAAKF